MRKTATTLVLALMGTACAAAHAQPPFTNPRDCITRSKSSAADPKRRTDLVACMLRGRSYIEGVRALEASGYVINSTETKKIEFAETSGQRERAGQLLEQLILRLDID